MGSEFIIMGSEFIIMGIFYVFDSKAWPEAESYFPSLQNQILKFELLNLSGKGSF